MKPVVLDIRNLSVEFDAGMGKTLAVDHISFTINEGESLGLVGESGSGKSVTAMLLMGLLPASSAKVLSGEILYTNKLGETKDLLKLSEQQRRLIRGKELGMIFQEPSTSLNPVISCGEQVCESLRIHLHLSNAEARKRTLNLFKEVQLDDPKRMFRSYPHELSGGQKQRIMIAMAIACNPRVLIADEPTTALDVTVQKNILILLEELQIRYEMSLLFISHDLAVLAGLADRILVMRQGKIVEENGIREVFLHPQNPYTKGLLACRPSSLERPFRLPTVESFLKAAHTEKLGSISDSIRLISTSERKAEHQLLFAQKPLISIQQISTHFQSRGGLFQLKSNTIHAVENVSFDVFPGETLGLVGESGSGKTTLGRSILRLIEPSSGKVFFKENELLSLNPSEMRKVRKSMQMVFQDPYSSLNPRMTAGEALIEPMIIHNLHHDQQTRKQKALELLDRVGLMPDHFNRFPNEFSGGQRQRICIARALASEPEFIIFDESVSSLDVSAQAVILNLINDLKEKYRFTCLFISHDLSVVNYMADRVVVMNQGRVEEIAEADSLYANPQSAYTQNLIAAIPLGRPQDIDRAIENKRLRKN